MSLQQQPISLNFHIILRLSPVFRNYMRHFWHKKTKENNYPYNLTTDPFLHFSNHKISFAEQEHFLLHK